MFPRILAFALATLWWQGAATCRDVNVSPFSPFSIWNTAVGSSAVYTPANVFADHTPYNVFGDDDYFIATQASDPLVPWYSQGWWNSTPHCELFPWTPFVKNLNWPANLTVSAAVSILAQDVRAKMIKIMHLPSCFAGNRVREQQRSGDFAA